MVPCNTICGTPGGPGGLCPAAACNIFGAEQPITGTEQAEFDTENYQIGSVTSDLAADSLVIGESGIYFLSFRLIWELQPEVPDSTESAEMRLNGATDPTSPLPRVFDDVTSNVVVQNASGVMPLSAGDVLTLFITHSGGAITRAVLAQMTASRMACL
jgi:hypothetical protein